MAGTQMKQGSTLEQMSGNVGIDAGGDPYDSAYIMNRKVARLAGSPVGLVDRDFQRLKSQSPRSLLQNTPTEWHSGLGVSGVLLAAARGRRIQLPGIFES